MKSHNCHRRFFAVASPAALAFALALPSLAGCAAAVAQPPAAAGALQTITNPRADGKFDYYGGLTFDASIPTPASVLGYEIGEQFTRHADMVRYLEMLAATSDRVHMQQYGESHQRFSLHLLTISSPENLARLDEILYNNRQLTRRDLDDARVEQVIADNPAIAWLSYTVHGNEPSTAETAIALAYTLAAATDPQIAEILDNVIVVIDPMLNPDGHNRYVSWFRNTMGVNPDANPDAAEHFEPWPGGRSNHYLFDLNRDWLWLVHPESRSRLIAYRQYMPQLHIDYHEQGYLNPYFLGAGDTPYNVNIPEDSKQWIELYGEANAEVFDERGLLYSSKERFDYLYPGYGKVLPVYHGAVGMLAEKAGHSRAGLAIEVNDDYTLTLTERAYHHWLLSMSNIETTAKNRRGQLERFRRFFTQACDPAAYEDNAYIIHGDNDPAVLHKLWDLCTSHGIKIHQLTQNASAAVHCYRHGEAADTDLPAGTWIIPSAQPMGALVTTLFERETIVEDKDTYDITSWNVPVAFGLRGGYVQSEMDAPMSRITAWAEPQGVITGDGSVALIVEARQHRFPQAIGLAVRHGLHARVAGEDFRVDEHDFSMGSLIIHRIRNTPEKLAAFQDDLLDLNMSGHWASRGMTESGPVLGANANRRLVLPKVALLRGSPTSSLSFGSIWHLLDIESPIPYSAINIENFGRVDLDRFNVIVIPEARGNVLSSSHADSLSDWVRAGGTVVAVGSSSTWAKRTLLNLRGDGTDDDNDEGEDDQPLSQLTFEQRRERGVENRVPGATLAATIDTTHPLAAGINPHDWVGIIKRGTRTLPVRDNGFVVARFDDDGRIGGSISDSNIQRIGGTPLMTVHRHGRGSVICLCDDPTMRGFQHHPTRLLLNAIVYGPTF